MVLLKCQLNSAHSHTDDQPNLLFWEAVMMSAIMYVKHAAKRMRTIGCYNLTVYCLKLQIIIQRWCQTTVMEEQYLTIATYQNMDCLRTGWYATLGWKL